ncbi:hypothetical protein C8J55DRAFT_563555 [Lentinula edodes]|uniref:C2H2-type domain-containing protein n=1 Tax=Lentinula lateritia TaxID=40482 RepID=A0A9W8ZZU1_9AGAR|nr:hypothetical protein GG344DRAFT_80485 [Lentinula edodes]KAJ4471263.1 hypothetical protein C8J55DRAFT_563555 [Lentinula edodes]
MIFDNSSTSVTYSSTQTSRPATETIGDRPPAFLPALSILKPYLPPAIQPEDTSGQARDNTIVKVPCALEKDNRPAGDTNRSTGTLRLPRILQVEKQTVTTSAIKMASTKRRKKEAKFLCPVPGCETTFTRRVNLNGKSFPF